MRDVLIDTSAWVDFFREREGPAGDRVAGLIRLDRAFMTGPIIAELLHGIRGERERRQIDILFTTIPCIDVDPTDWITTGNQLRELRKKGVTVPLTDVLIARIAIRKNMAILTLDRHFQHLSAPLVLGQD